ncbi:MAG: hypothetical protein FWB78_06655 [Treponema sp.]|nr:hypothetical protein [Treponema sp.]
MKRRTLVVIALAVTVVLTTACGSNPAPQPVVQTVFVERQPQLDPLFERAGAARRNAPQGSIVGIGVSTHSNQSLAQSTAEQRARAELIRQIVSVTHAMISDATIGSEQEPAVIQFSEAVSRTLAAREIAGGLIIDQALFYPNRMLMVARVSRGDIEMEIRSASEAHAALAPHVNAGMWALDRMSEALRENNMLPTVIRDHD